MRVSVPIRPWAFLAVIAACTIRPGGADVGAPPPNKPAPLARANDNRAPAGHLRGGILEIDLDAVVAGWRPDLDVDTAVTVQAFAERGRKAEIPGPLVRVPQGTEVRATIRNLASPSPLVVTGFRAGTVAADTVTVAAGATREIRFRAALPGTFLYWGTTTGSAMVRRMGRDAQLTGAIVVDPTGARPDPEERILVITLIQDFPPPMRLNNGVWEIAVNGRSWPHTERFTYQVGDTVRWRWVNGTNRPHPMHLHGFHFLVTAKGTGYTDTLYSRESHRLAVTELLPPAFTFAMEWVPRRAGNWLMHCHMIPHIAPFPERPTERRAHDVHDVARHATEAMAGLVLGITTLGRDLEPSRPRPDEKHLRLLVQETRPDSGHRPVRGYVLQRGAEPRPDSVEVPGSPLILVRGQRVVITVVNRLAAPTSVHWHGMELESYFDGVAGWSGTRRRRAPLIAPGDSFTVAFTPPRAGTYMYHTHMDELDQLASGLYAPMIVLEPTESYDPETDLTFVFGSKPNFQRVGNSIVVNGMRDPTPIELQAGRDYRLRLINLLPAAPAEIDVKSDTTPSAWLPISKDGAELRSSARRMRPSRVRMGVGESYDFIWRPQAHDAVMKFRIAAPGGPPDSVMQTLVVRR